MNYPVKVNTKFINAQLALCEIKALKANGQDLQAVELGLSTLKQLGISIKKEPSLWTVLKEVNKTKDLFSPRKIKRIPRGKALNAKKSKMILAILAEMTMPALKVNEKLWSIVMMWIARLSIKKGSSEYAAIGYAGFAMLSVKYLEDDVQAELLYRSTMTLLSNYDNLHMSALAKFILGAYVGHMFVSWDECIRLMDEGAAEAFEVDDYVLGGLCTAYGIEMTFVSGASLVEITDRIEEAKVQQVIACNQDVQVIIDLYENFVACMAIETCHDYRERLLPDQSDPALHLPVHLTQGMLHLTMAYNYGHLEEAASLIEGFTKEIESLKVHFITGVFYVYEVLVLAGLSRDVHERYLSKKKRRVQQLKSMFRYWVKRNPYNYGHSYKICEGVFAQMTGNYDLGEAAFEKAIELAKGVDSVYGKALATIALAQHCSLYDRAYMARYYMTQGAELFELWQGHGISQHILHKENILIEYDQISARWSSERDTVETECLSDVYYLTEQLSLVDSEAMSSLLNLVRGHYNVDKALLVMDYKGQLLIEAMHGVEGELGLDIEGLDCVSTKTIRSVYRDSQYVKVNKDGSHQLATYDAYIMDKRTGSILALPLMAEGCCIGVLYLERSQVFEDSEADVIQRVVDYASYNIGQQGKEALELSGGEWTLTEKEIKVLEALKAGMSIKEISLDLAYPLNQMLMDMKDLYERLGGKNLFELLCLYKLTIGA